MGLLKKINADHLRRVAESERLASFEARRKGEDAHHMYSRVADHQEAIIAQRVVETAYKLLPQVESMDLHTPDSLELTLDPDLGISQEVAFGAVSFVASANDRDFEITWEGIKFTIEPDQTMEEIQNHFSNVEHITRIGQISQHPAPRS